MSETLQVGVDAARKAFPSVPVQVAAHPKGNSGVAQSVARVNEKILEGAKDWRMREWAGQALKKAGDPSRVRDQAQAILDALRAQTVYVQDPPGVEMVQRATATLCLEGDRGVCLRAGDCDDLVVTYCSAVMSIGISAKTIIQAFNGNDTYQHILCAVYDDANDEWLKVDPSHKTWPVGEASFASKEKWFDPMDKSKITLTDSGEYVGVGRMPQFAKFGIGDGGISDAAQAVEESVQEQFDAFSTSVTNLQGALSAVAVIRTQLRPSNPFDPEPYSIASISDFPTDGLWTESMDSIAHNFLAMCQVFEGYANDAIDGARNVFIDTQSGEAFIEQKPGDTWSLSTVVQSAEDSILGLYNSATNAWSYFTSKLGTNLTPQQVQQAQQSGTVQGLPRRNVGVGSWQIVAGVALGVVVAVGAFYALGKLCDYLTASAREATNKTVLDMVASGQITEAQGQRLLEAVGMARKAAAEEDAARNPPSKTDWSKLVEWLVIGGLGVGSVVLIAPVVREVVASHADARVARRPKAA